MLLSVIALLAASFLLRLQFSISESSDDLWHLHRIDHIDSCTDYSHNYPNAIPDGCWIYPSLTHLLAARLCPGHSFAAAKFLNIGYDCVLILWSFFLCILVFRGVPVPAGSSDIAFQVAVLVATFPLLFPDSARLKGAGGRTLGGLLFVFYMTSIFALNNGLSPFFYGIAVFLAYLIFLTSEFAIQALLGTTVLLSICTGSLTPVLPVVIAVAVSWLLPGSAVPRIIRYKLSHYRWYCRNMKGTGAEGRNRLRDLFRFPILMVRDPRAAVVFLLRGNSLVIALYSAPLLIIGSILYLANPGIREAIHGNNGLYFLILWVFASLVLFGLTSLPPLLFLGQAERYLEYAAIPISILTVYSAYLAGWNVSMTVIAILLLHIAVISATFLASNHRLLAACLSRQFSADARHLLQVLAADERHRRIITVPVKWAYGFSSYDRKNRYYLNFVHQGKAGFRYMEEDQDSYNFVNPDLTMFRQKYGIDTFIFEKKYLREFSYPLKDLIVLAENEQFLLCEFPH